MTKFVQIGNEAINLALVGSITFEEHNVYFFFGDDIDAGIILQGKEAELFKAWWELNSDVEVIP